MDSVGRNTNLAHTSRPAHACERPAKARPEFNAVIWITLFVRRYRPANQI